ncbi:MAG: hypothetical protein ACK4S6_16215 [Roseateles asaccharophilus]|uniref:hypothetical protein n=1 Tax=Roseateles asaccharophilus TaxID=582607 RepID=UPI00391BD5F4
MCGVQPTPRECSTPAQRRAHTLDQIGRGSRKVIDHTERLRKENPRIYAAMKPLLDDLAEWMESVGHHLKDEARRVSDLT